MKTIIQSKHNNCANYFSINVPRSKAQNIFESLQFLKQSRIIFESPALENVINHINTFPQLFIF